MYLASAAINPCQTEGWKLAAKRSPAPPPLHVPYSPLPKSAKPLIVKEAF